MKNILLGIFTAAIIFVSCSKENEKNSLEGTNWSFSETNYGDVDYYSETISFLSGGIVTITTREIKDNDGWTDIEQGTYTYNPPTVTFSTSGYGIKAEYTGTIIGNTMIVTNKGYSKTYTKD